jgi:hypothetical protein
MELYTVFIIMQDSDYSKPEVVQAYEQEASTPYKAEFLATEEYVYECLREQDGVIIGIRQDLERMKEEEGHSQEYIKAVRDVFHNCGAHRAVAFPNRLINRI